MTFKIPITRYNSKRRFFSETGSTVIACRLPNDVIAAINRLCAKKNMTFSDFSRAAVAEKLAKGRKLR